VRYNDLDALGFGGFACLCFRLEHSIGCERCRVLIFPKTISVSCSLALNYESLIIILGVYSLVVDTSRDSEEAI
jgi:hypothetical protein